MTAKAKRVIRAFWAASEPGSQTGDGKDNGGAAAAATSTICQRGAQTTTLLCEEATALAFVGSEHRHIEGDAALAY